MASRQQEHEWRNECETQGERWVRGQQEASIGSPEKLQYQRRWLKQQQRLPYIVGAVMGGVFSLVGTIVGALLTAFLAAGCPK
jgi:hypothetical protein